MVNLNIFLKKKDVLNLLAIWFYVSTLEFCISLIFTSINKKLSKKHPYMMEKNLFFCYEFVTEVGIKIFLNNLQISKVWIPIDCKEDELLKENYTNHKQEAKQ